ncbi:hypothetical protein BDU57DRAFT_597526 [Ampelomyces quisqualis]|uniref:Mid2 domain-containing protein n=1 Tax=Ampelomyces quisqualis TaxID=50730 RepID=A0A6A5QE73_AMPQU|nr:hypothetical protein BDU57DRAFT_597526 [Ampelomyces quisqualis]
MLPALSLLLVASALPAPSLEPSIVTKVAISTGTRFGRTTPKAPGAIVHRQWDWAPSAPPSAPAVPAWTAVPQPSWTPSPVATAIITPTPTWSPSPTPSYSWEETHNDDKNTLTHEIIAAIVVGSFVGIPILGCIFFCIYRKFRGNNVKNQGRAGDIEAAKMTSRPGSNGTSDVASLEGSAVEMRRFGADGVGQRGITVDRIEHGEPMHFSRGGDLRRE